MNTKRVARWLVVLFMGSAFADATPRAPAWSVLAPFESAREFDRYRQRVREAAKQNGLWWGSMRQSWRGHPLLAQNQPELPCDPALRECDEIITEDIVVTGVRAATRSSAQSSSAVAVAAESMTNNQVSAVDEGDIVKAFDRFFVVLHQGRLYSIDTGGGAGSLRVADRADAYQSRDVDSWIDEILIHDDIVLVTGYSYRVGAATIALFRIGRDGRFQFLTRYFIESNDYFSGENYATRIIGGKLVIYTPVYLPDVPAGAALPIPRIRSWSAGRGFSGFEPLFDITDLYRPVQRTLAPALHVISVCPIDARAFRCRSRGIVGPWRREMYVAEHDAYLWLSGEEDETFEADARRACDAGRRPFGGRGVPSAVYRVPIDGGDITGALTSGTPNDQLVLEERAGSFWALVDVIPMRCRDGEPEADQEQLRLTRIPTRFFSRRPYRLGDGAWFDVPQVADGEPQARYSDGYLLYGRAQGAWRALLHERDGTAYEPGLLAVVPLADPRAARTLALPHGVERVELFGAHALVFGYPDPAGLAVTAVALDGTPRVTSTARLPGAVEAEGRSHAFNGAAAGDGSGVFGIPTIDLTTWRTGRWRNLPSDVSFVTADAALTLTSAEKLEAGAAPAAAGYVCEVSCYDWYGNARPIFFRGRVFALTGREMIEGTITAGRVVEIARVNMVR